MSGVQQPKCMRGRRARGRRGDPPPAGTGTACGTHTLDPVCLHSKLAMQEANRLSVYAFTTSVARKQAGIQVAASMQHTRTRPHVPHRAWRPARMHT